MMSGRRRTGRQLAKQVPTTRSNSTLRKREEQVGHLLNRGQFYVEGSIIDSDGRPLAVQRSIAGYTQLARKDSKL